MKVQQRALSSASGARRCAVSLLALTALCGTAVGQVDYTWASPVSGPWTDPSNWIPGQVPNGADHRAVLGFESAYEVLLNNQPVVLDQLRIENPSAVLRVVKSSGTAPILSIGAGGIVNRGTLLFQGSSESWMMAKGATISGDGVIRIEGPSMNWPHFSPPLVQHLAGHTIAGHGAIGRFVNDGLIVSDVPGKTLKVQNVHNNGSIVVLSECHIDVSGVPVPFLPTATGIILAEGHGATITGSIRSGTIETRDGGVFSGATLLNVTTVGDVVVRDIKLGGEVTHNGRFMLDAGTLTTYYELGGPCNLGGSGEIVMTHPDSRIVNQLALTHPMNYHVHGQGEIASKVQGLVSQGRISADVEGGELKVSSVNNAGVFEAADGASLILNGQMQNAGEIASRAGSNVQIGGHVFQSDEGVIRAEGTTNLGTSCCEVLIDGGSIECTDVGVLQAEGPLVLTGVRLAGRVGISRYGVRMIFDCTNDGEIVLGSLHSAALRLGSFPTPSSIEGFGTITLNHPESKIDLSSQIIATIGAGQRIRGSGRILAPNAPAKLAVHGTISPGFPDVPFGVMQVVNLSQSSTSVMELDIGASQRDIVQLSSGTNTLDGLLRVRFHDGKTLTACEELALFENAVYTGTFDTYDLPAMPLGRLQVRYEPSAIILVYNPADHDGSTFVDTDDFTAFMTDFEAGSDAADINHSGAVDGEDFADFVAAFEQGC